MLNRSSPVASSTWGMWACDATAVARASVHVLGAEGVAPAAEWVVEEVGFFVAGPRALGRGQSGRRVVEAERVAFGELAFGALAGEVERETFEEVDRARCGRGRRWERRTHGILSDDEV